MLLSSGERRLARLASHLNAGAASSSSSSSSSSYTSSIEASAVAAAAAPKAPKRVLITGAAGQIAYSLIFLVARGDMLGFDQPMILHLLDVPVAEPALQGVVMELQDGAYPLVHGVVATSDVQKAFTGVEVALLVGAMPRQKGMERKDLLLANANIFREQGRALNAYAADNVRVCVVGNPANTNCYITMANAPRLPKTSFSALTRLDQNRAVSQIAAKAGAPVSTVADVFIWGNHSATQVPDASRGTVRGVPISKVITDTQWLARDFVQTVQQRGAAVIAARKASSAASAAKAIVDHVHDWLLGSNGKPVSMAVPSDGSYGITKDLVFSFPVVCSPGGSYQIVRHYAHSPEAVAMLRATEQELIEERDTAMKVTGK